MKEAQAGNAPAPEEKPNDYLTKEAARWLFNSEAIADSGFAPVRYTGKETLRDLCNILGHALTLEEAMIPVQPDGEKRTCSSEGHDFQPVRFINGVSGKLEGQLRSGLPLAKCEIHYTGAFFKNRGVKDDALLAFSGSIFKPDGLTEASGSPLVIAEIEYAKALKKEARKKGQDPRLIPNRMRGECLDHIQGRIGAPKEQGIKEYKERVSRIRSQFAGAALFGRFTQDPRGRMPNTPFARLRLSPVKSAEPNGHEQAAVAK